MTLPLFFKSPVLLGSVTGTIAIGGTVTVLALPRSVSNNYVVFEEATMGETTSANNTFKCQLEKGEIVQLCELWKITEAPGKSNGWIDYERFKEIGKASTSTTTEKERFVLEKGAIYKVKTAKELIEEWEKDTTKKLNIFPKASTDKKEDVLSIAIPKLAVHANNKFAGKSKFFVGRAKYAVGSENTLRVESFKASGKWFKCDTPIVATAEYNCNIYVFDPKDTSSKQWETKTLNSSLTKVSEIKYDIHYLIRFDEETTINKDKYNTTSSLGAVVFTDLSRTNKVSGAIYEVDFKEISHVVMFGDEGGYIDLALIL